MVEIITDTVDIFKEDKFCIATTSANDYYPFYSQFTKKYIGLGISTYCKPVYRTNSYGITRYSDLFQAFSNRMNPLVFNFEIDDEPHLLYIAKGIIADRLYRPLFVLATNDYNNSSNNEYSWNYVPDYSKFKLFISTDFVKNPIYKNIWRKMDKDYVQDCFEKDIVVEFNTVENIEKKLFSNEFNLQFNNIIELQDILNNEVTPLLFRDFDTYTQVEQEVFSQEESVFSGELQESIIHTSNEADNLIHELSSVDAYGNELDSSDTFTTEPNEVFEVVDDTEVENEVEDNLPF